MSVNETEQQQKPKETVLDPNRMARLIARKHLVRYYNGGWFKWDVNRFRPIKSVDTDYLVGTTLKHVIDTQFITDDNGMAKRLTRTMRADALAALKEVVYLPSASRIPFWTDGSEGNAPMFAMANGLIKQADAINGNATLYPHVPGYFNTMLFPYDYDPSATAPRWEAFLKQVLENDAERINILQELAGYLLIPSNEQHKFFMLLGSGANGKSAVIRVLEGLVGEENRSAVSLGVFGERFALMTTVGKLLNVCPEADETDEPPMGLMKQYIAGDTITVDVKYNDPITIIPTARLVIAANSRPKFLDTSDGLWRRLVAIPFRVTIPEAQQDKQIFGKLLAELPGIFNWALVGLQRLQDRGMFTQSTLVTQEVAGYKLENNPAHQFLIENGYVQGGPDDFVVFPKLYEDYATWCKDFGYRPKNHRNFGKEVSTLFPQSERAQRTVGMTKGIRVRTGILRLNQQLAPEGDEVAQDFSEVKETSQRVIAEAFAALKR